MGGSKGFKPSQSESQSEVLSLHHEPHKKQGLGFLILAQGRFDESTAG